MVALAAALVPASGSPVVPHGSVIAVGPLPGDSNGGANAINNLGQVVGFAQDESFHDHGYLWDGSRLVALLPLDGDGGTFPTAINDQGVIAGNSESALGEHAVIWKDGQVIALPALSGDVGSTAVAMNSHGTVAGESFSSDGSHNAVMWVNGQPKVLTGIPSSVQFHPRAIDDRGQVAGVGYADGPNLEPFVWERGRLRRWGKRSDMSAFVWQMNSKAQVVGYSMDAQLHAHGSVWKSGSTHLLPALNGAISGWPMGINDRGDVVGWSGYDTVIWPRGQQPVELNSTLDADAPVYIAEAQAINNRGQITGWGYDHSGKIVPYLYTPSTSGN